MTKCYAVWNIGSREMLTEWTTDQAQANEWAAECEIHETEPVVEVIEQEMTDLDLLERWASWHEGEFMNVDLAATCPPCEGWYPIVDQHGVLTGDLAAADDERYTQADDVLGCVRLREGQ
jgi:hypothetical protein